MNYSQYAIQRAWDQLSDGASIGDLNASWRELTRLRREFDDAIVALAQAIEYLRTVTEEPTVAETEIQESDETETDTNKRSGK